MLEADTFIYVLLRDFILSNIYSRNNYTEHGITKMMYFSRHILVVFVEIMLYRLYTTGNTTGTTKVCTTTCRLWQSRSSLISDLSADLQSNVARRVLQVEYELLTQP